MNQLGKYRLIAEIARGGMGIVYLAVAQGPARFSKLVVIKELKPEYVEDGSFLEMFLEEARLAARLHHPNVVQTNEVDSDGDRHFMVMEYLEGAPLGRFLSRRREQFPLPLHLAVLSEVLHGLAYAHTLADFGGTPLGLVHRDVTPQNVFLTTGGEVKLLDFGIAKALDSTIETSAGVMKGKPAYMAREQVTGDADARSDVFSVGVMLWEALAQRRMWDRRKDIEILSGVLSGDLPRIEDARPDAPPELVRICRRALATSRADRYPSASSMQADLDAYRHVHTPANLRDLGKLVGDAFAAERAQTKTLIEAHLGALRDGNASTALLTLPTSSRDGSLTPGRTQTPVGAASLATGTQAATTTDIASARAPYTRAVMLGAAVAALAVAAGMFVLRRDPPPPAAPVAVTTAGSDAPAPRPAGVTTHEVSVTVLPPSAALSIDGRAMPNPGSRSCIEGATVLLQASAVGYTTRTREIPCDAAKTLELALVPEAGRRLPVVAPVHAPPPRSPAAAAASETKPVASAPPRPPADVSTSGGTKPLRPIETASPYANP